MQTNLFISLCRFILFFMSLSKSAKYHWPWSPRLSKGTLCTLWYLQNLEFNKDLIIKASQMFHFRSSILKHSISCYLLFLSCKVHMFWESAQKFAKSPPYFWLALRRTKVRWRFCKIVWPSQDIWTLAQFQLERSLIQHIWKL